MAKTNTPRKPKPDYGTPPAEHRGDEFLHATAISPPHFELCEDGTVRLEHGDKNRAPVLCYRDDTRGLLLYHGNCLELLDALGSKYPEGRFDCIFADPPYFLSN